MTSEANDQSNIEIIRGNNKALIVWEDFANGIDFNITGQIIDVNSMELIGDNIAICHEDLYQGSPTLAYDGDGRFIVAWEDERGVDNGDPALSGGLDVYVQIVTEEGLQYQAGGIIVASEYHDQSLPQLQHLYFNDYGDPVWMLYWIDMRSSGKEDLKNLYAQGIEIVESSIEDDFVPTEFKVSAAYPNPFNGAVALDVEISEVGPVIFSITNILGQMVYQQTLLPTRAGKFQITWNGRDQIQKGLPSGIYFYSVNTNVNIVSGKFTYLK
ncbi:MAG TPA: T9SS type A sorting domain-containing protein [Candidatus Marinimicrobia bacterium]|nr:T9SS type A sorting domain-containing protein [Candidatus Neomarinimicrobiota bacterium]